MIFLGIFLLELFLLFLSSKLVTRTLGYVFLHATRSERATIYATSFLFFPGVVVHELAHYLTARVLFVHAEGIEFVPKLQDGGLKLGSVSIAKTDPIRRMLIGVAPVLFGVTVLLWLLFYLFLSDRSSLHFLPTWAQYLITGYILFVVGNTMFSSKKDMEGAVEFLSICLLLLVFFYLLGIRLPSEWFSSFSQSTTSAYFLKQMTILFLVPLGMNVSIATVLRFVIR